MKNLLAIVVVLGLACSSQAADKDPVNGLVKTLMTGDDDARLKAALDLGRAGKGAVEPVAALLTNSDADVRYYAVWALGLVGAEAKDRVPDVIKLLRDAKPDVRRKAAFALGRIGQGKDVSVPALVTALRDTDPDVRSTAIDALSRFGDDAAPAFADLLRDADQATATDAANRLVVIGKSALPALAKALDGNSPSARRLAVAAVARIDHADAILVLLDALGARKADVRASAAARLAERGVTDKLVVLRLGEVMTGDAEENVRHQAAAALRTLGVAARPAEAALTRALGDDSLIVGLAAFDALANCRPDPHGTAEKALAGSDVRVRLNVAAVMTRRTGTDHPPLLKALTELLGHEEPRHRYRAAFILARGLQTPGKTVGVLVEALRDRQTGLREEAAECLTNLGRGAVPAVPALDAATKDDDATVRRAAYWALGKVLPEAREARETLGRALRDDDADVRFAAVRAVRDRFGDAGVPEYLTALKDREAKVRAEAAKCLAAVAVLDKSVVPTLMDLAENDPDSNVREHSAAALKNARP